MEQHVQLPNDMDLEPKDLLIYLCIKRYMNKDTHDAFPALSTLSKKSGASINTIRKAITRLKDDGYIEIRKEGRKNIYHFTKYVTFEPFSYAFMDMENITFTEKAYLVASQQYMIKDNGIGKISYSNGELSDKIHMPESTISKCNRTLTAKNYLEVIPTKNGSEKIFPLTERLAQSIVFAICNHEDRIKTNTNDINELKLQMEELRKQNQSLIKDRDLILKSISPTGTGIMI